MSTLTDSKRQTTLERWAFTIEFALANLREFEQKILAARGDWVRLVSAGVIPYSDWMDDVLREEFWRREINFAHREMHDAGAKLISGLQVLARETQRTTLAIITKLSRVRAFSPMPLEMRPQVQPMAEPFYV